MPHQKRAVLAMDKASLTVKNELDSDILVSWVSDHCYQVSLPFIFWSSLIFVWCLCGGIYVC